LDISVKDTGVCIVDGTGKIVREVKVASEPAALLPVLTNLIAALMKLVWPLAADLISITRPCNRNRNYTLI
jgi:predicted NBD/HSP70 family sugar kinase